MRIILSQLYGLQHAVAQTVMRFLPCSTTRIWPIETDEYTAPDGFLGVRSHVFGCATKQLSARSK